MAHESSANSDHRLHAPPKSSRMENIRSLSMRDRPRSGTPKMERSISSMTDSFMLEHYPHTSTPPQTPQSEVDSLLLAAKDDLTPISNWAHLTYLKKQRNSLRTELKAQQIAGAEVRASVAGLRRVAFRMAVNISVKEKQIATTARNLMSSRRNDYLSTRNAERRIEQLTMILKEEERRNRDILESLERASMLTLEYSNPEPQPRDRNQSSLLSPPPSPPTRLSALTRESPPTPKTPTRSNHASWDNIRWDLTPGEIRTPDNRLIRAKRESDRALTVFRTRIEELQADCLRGKENTQLLEVTQSNLEEEIRCHQSRIATLQRSRDDDEEKLRFTRSQLEDSVQSASEFRADLERKTNEIGQLAEIAKTRQDSIRALEQEKATLQKGAEEYRCSIQKLETHTTELEEEVKSIQVRLEAATGRGDDLENRLVKSEVDHNTTVELLKKSQSVVCGLEASINTLDIQVNDYTKRMHVSGEELSTLRAALEDSEGSKRRTENALAVARSSISSLESSLRTSTETRTQLKKELESTYQMKAGLEKEIDKAKEKLCSEFGQKNEIQSELNSMRSSHERMEKDLQTAHDKIHSFQQQDSEAQEELETMRRAKASLLQDLGNTRRSCSESEASLQIIIDKLATTESSLGASQDKLKESEQSRSSLEDELCKLHQSKTDVEKQVQGTLQSEIDLKAELNSSHARLTVAETDNRHLQSNIFELQHQLHQNMHSKESLEERLGTIEAEKASSQVKLSGLQDELREIQKLKIHAGEQFDAVQSEKVALTTKMSQLQEELLRNEAVKNESEKHVEDLLMSNTGLGSELDSTRSLLAAAEFKETELQSRISEMHENVSLLQRSKETAETRLAELSKEHTNLKDELSLTLSNLRLAESESTDLASQLSVANQEMTDLRKANTELEERLQGVLISKSGLEEQLRSTRSCLSEVESESSNLMSKISISHKEFESLHSTKTAVEDLLKAAIASNSIFDRDLDSARLLLEHAEVEDASLRSRISEADKEVGTLRQTNAKLDASEKGLYSRLEAADEELKSVQQANERLEKFLEHVQQNMIGAEAAIEESEKRLEKFMGEHNAKLNAARNSQLQYEQSLSERAKELEALMGENSELHHQHSEQGQQLDSMKTSKSMLLAELHDKDKAIRELVWGHESQLEAELKAKDTLLEELQQSNKCQLDDKDAEIDELQKSHASQLQAEVQAKDLEIDELQKSHASQLQVELRAKESIIDQLQKSNDEFAASIATLELELGELKDSKKLLEQLVDTLQKKILHLEAPEEQEQSVNPDTTVVSVDASGETSSPPTIHDNINISRPSSTRAQRSAESARPSGRVDATPSNEYLDAWAKEVERVRMLRDDTVVQLKSMKQAKYDLKKSLKESEAQLLSLEQHNKPQRHRTLQKRRPSHLTPTSPQSPSRPATAGMLLTAPDPHNATSRQEDTERPKTSGFNADRRRWSSFPRPGSENRPTTSSSFANFMGHRPVTGVSMGSDGSAEKEKGRRRWSSSLKKLFKGGA